jgi:DNA-binding response OmpR family regulator
VKWEAQSPGAYLFEKPAPPVINFRPMRQGDDQKNEIYDDGYLRVEYANYYVACGGRPIYNLSRVELLLFFTMVRNFERLVTHEALWKAAWGKKTPYNVRTLRVQLSNLRLKLLPYGLNITTMVNVGYRLIRSNDEAAS